jgi:hypothetical protein
MGEQDMKTKSNRTFNLVGILTLIVIALIDLSSCDNVGIDMGARHYKTTEDGFKYYYNDNSKNSATIVGIPDVEELCIPEYIDGKNVQQLGLRNGGMFDKDYKIDGKNVKEIYIQHSFVLASNGSGGWMVSFPNLEVLTFIDFPYCKLYYSDESVVVPYYIGTKETNIPIVELKKSNRILNLSNFKANTIVIPEYVEKIDSGVFDGLTDVIIKTSYEAKPEGWQDGWNGNCPVEWGFQINY